MVRSAATRAFCVIGRSSLGVTAELRELHAYGGHEHGRQKLLDGPDHGIRQQHTHHQRRSGKEAGPLTSYSLSVRTGCGYSRAPCQPWCRRTSARQGCHALDFRYPAMSETGPSPSELRRANHLLLRVVKGVTQPNSRAEKQIKLALRCGLVYLRGRWHPATRSGPPVGADGSDNGLLHRLSPPRDG